MLQFLILSVSSSICFESRCDPNLDTCFASQPDVVYKQCPNTDEYCDAQTQQCQIWHPPPSVAFPGEKCSQYCLGKCLDGICYGKRKNEECQNTLECHSGLRCVNGECVGLISAGSYGCYENYDCDNNSICKDNLCVLQHSLDNGEPCGHSDNFRARICKSGICVKNRCTEKPAPKKVAGTKCHNDGYCEFDIEDTILLAQCACEHGENPEFICPYTIFDPFYQGYIDAMIEWRTGEGIRQCNSYRRDDEQCIRSWANPELLGRILKFEAVVNCGLYIKNAEECIIQAICPQYYDILLKQTDDDDPFNPFHYNSGQFPTLPLLSLIFIIQKNLYKMETQIPLTPNSLAFQEANVKKFLIHKHKQQNYLNELQQEIKKDYKDIRVNLDMLDTLTSKRCNDTNDSIMNEINRLQGNLQETIDECNKESKFLRRQFEKLQQEQINNEHNSRMLDNKATKLEHCVGIDIELPILEEFNISLEVQRFYTVQVWKLLAC